MADLEELAGRAERASADETQEIVHAAFRLIHPRAKVTRQPGFEHINDGIGPYTVEHRAWQVLDQRMAKWLCAGAFVDAAISLVPDGNNWRVDFQHQPIDKMPPYLGLVWKEIGRGRIAYATDPALALTAAALRARALSRTQGNQNG